MTDSADLSLLIDLGTNGELVIGNSDWLVCCSASAGPSFEGGGITCGMRATTGAIEHISLKPDGKIAEYSVVGGGKPVGICGSGLIDAIAELLRIGCIDRRGRFVGSRMRPPAPGGGDGRAGVHHFLRQGDGAGKGHRPHRTRHQQPDPLQGIDLHGGRVPDEPRGHDLRRREAHLHRRRIRQLPGHRTGRGDRPPARRRTGAGSISSGTVPFRARRWRSSPRMPSTTSRSGSRGR